MKDLACRFRCMQSHLRIRVRSKPAKQLSPNVGQLLLCDAAKCGCPCALTPDQIMHLGVIPSVLDRRPSEFCQAINGQPGQGLYTTIALQSGSLIAPYIGELTLNSENQRDEEQYKEEGQMCYAFELPLSEDSNLRPLGRHNKVVVDPTRFGGLARYVNHSCHPNLDFIMVRAGKELPVSIVVSLSLFFSWLFCRCIFHLHASECHSFPASLQVLYLYARCDIASETELTMSYGSQLTYACMCSHCRQMKAKKRPVGSME